MDNSQLALLYKDSEECQRKHSDRVSVVIVTYNKFGYVRDLIKSFEHLNYDRDLIDIIVVDNASVDGTEEKLKAEFADEITIIQTGANLGGAGGFNTGMRYAMERLENDFIWLLDNDVVVHSESLNELMDATKANPDAAAVGSMILQLDNPELVNEIGASINWREGKTSLIGHDAKFADIDDKDIREVEYSPACSLMKTRRSIAKVGYWQELFIHFDDVDWCLRAQQRGLKIYCNPKSLVFHESMHNKQPTWIKYYNVRNLLYLYKNFKPLMLVLGIAKFVSWLVYFFVHGYFKNARMVTRAMWDFFCGKKGQGNFVLEKYQSINDYDFSQLKAESNMVFSSYANFLDFLALSNYKPAKGSKVFIYNISPDEKLSFANDYPELELIYKAPGFISWLGFGIKQILTCSLSDKQVIFDGRFEGYMMFPCFKAKLVVYPNYKTLVDLN